MNYRSSLALATIVSVGTVFSVLPAPNDISASQSVVVDASELRREVRIEVMPDVHTVKPEAVNQPILVVNKSTAVVSESDFVLNDAAKQEPLLVANNKPAKPNVSAVNKSEITLTNTGVFTVPFFSQFTDITPVEWKKVGCGIASLAMLVDFYKPGSASVDELLQDGIASGAYLSNAGWTHAGLINIAKQFGLRGESRSLADLSMTDAFDKLATVVSDGPVMVSVHYTFEPTNPIPHLVVVNGVRDGKVFYNDPAEVSGGGSLSIDKFKSAWKKRYISIRPA